MDRANERKYSSPASPITDRTAFTTPRSQKHRAASARRRVPQHESYVPPASRLQSPAMPVKTSARQSTGGRGSKYAACEAARPVSPTAAVWTPPVATSRAATRRGAAASASAATRRVSIARGGGRMDADTRVSRSGR